jgi:hypothetical protein
MSSSFKVANSTISYGTLTSNSVNAATITTDGLRVSTVEADAPAGMTTRTVKLYAPVEWAVVGNQTVCTLSTVKGQSQTAGLPPSAFVLPAYATIDYARFGCKYSSTVGAPGYDMGLSGFGTTPVSSGDLVAAGTAATLDTSSGGVGSGLAVNNFAVAGSAGVAPVGPTGASYVTATPLAAQAGVAAGETLEVYLTYTTASA